jgi:hypothetical protein
VIKGFTGVVVEEEREIPESKLADLAEPSAGEKAVNLVSGVPLKDPDTPVVGLGDCGLNIVSRD